MPHSEKWRCDKVILTHYVWFIHSSTGTSRRSVLEDVTPEKLQYSETFTIGTMEPKGRVLRQTPVFSQCYTGTSCSGSIVTAASARECCVDTETGLSYSNSAGCTPCIGEG